MNLEARLAIERTITEDRIAIALARQEVRRIDDVLRESYRVRRDVLPKLRKMGLVR